jgi:hypothetical protein
MKNQTLVTLVVPCVSVDAPRPQSFGYLATQMATNLPQLSFLQKQGDNYPASMN